MGDSVPEVVIYNQNNGEKDHTTDYATSNSLSIRM